MDAASAGPPSPVPTQIVRAERTDPDYYAYRSLPSLFSHWARIQVMQHLYTYAMVKALYEKGKDYVDAFWPLVLKVANQANAHTAREIQDALREQVGLSIPQHSLDTVLDRAHERKVITRSRSGISITESGRTYLAKMESPRDVERRLNELVDDARLYLMTEHQIGASREQVSQMLHGVIAKNIQMFSSFTTGVESDELSVEASAHGDEGAVLAYLLEVDRARPRVFDTLRDLIYGSIIYASIYTRSFSGNATKSFRRTKVYLDTNLIFGFLGLDHDEANVPAQELNALLKASGRFDLHVFDFTLHELNLLMRRYSAESHRYTPGVKVNTVFSSLRQRGWRETDVTEFLATIDRRLQSSEISVITTGIDLRKFTPEDPDARSALLRYKPEQQALGMDHDLAAIELVRRLRRRSVRHVEEAAELFLTSDIRLSRYTFIEGGHRDAGTVSEVLPDRLLTNLLWLKSPATLDALPLGSIIALHSKDLFINHAVWRRFSEIVTTMQREEKLDSGDVTILVYDRQVQEMLRRVDRDQVGEIDEGFVLDALEGAREQVEKDRMLAVLATASEVEDRARNEMTQREQEFAALVAAERETARDREQALLTALLERERKDHEALTGIQGQVRRSADRSASIIVWTAILLLVTLLMGSGFLIIPVVKRNWEAIEPVQNVVGPLVTISAALLGLPSLLGRDRVRRWLSDKLYQRRLGEMRHHLKHIERVSVNAADA